MSWPESKIVFVYLVDPRSPPRTLCDRLEPPRAPIPPKVAPPRETWEAVSLQRGVNFHIFAWTKNRNGRGPLTLKIRGPEAPQQPRHSAKKRKGRDILAPQIDVGYLTRRSARRILTISLEPSRQRPCPWPTNMSRSHTKSEHNCSELTRGAPPATSWGFMEPSWASLWLRGLKTSKWSVCGPLFGARPRPQVWKIEPK